jgi:hypothetical protein
MCGAGRLRGSGTNYNRNPTAPGGEICEREEFEDGSHASASLRRYAEGHSFVSKDWRDRGSGSVTAEGRAMRIDPR